MAAAVEVEGLCVGYGAADVLRNVSLDVQDGECVAILGANGAGKTTLLRALSGLRVPRAGRVRFFGGVPRRHAPWTIARLGVAHVPEGRGTIGELTVEENLLAGAFLRKDAKGVRDDLERCFERFPILRTYRRRVATRLSGGEQQMLALSRALMMRPRLMLLDEPSFGLAPKIVTALYEALATIVRDESLSVLLVEQSVELAERLAGRAYLIKNGVVVAEGSIAELRTQDTLKDAYFSAAGTDA